MRRFRSVSTSKIFTSLSSTSRDISTTNFQKRRGEVMRGIIRRVDHRCVGSEERARLFIEDCANILGIGSSRPYWVFDLGSQNLLSERREGCR